MIYSKIIYFVHLLLHSQYKILITLLVYLIFYITIKNTNLAYCMTEGTDFPTVAEAKNEVSHEVLALKKEITDYSSRQIELLEEIKKQDKISEELDTKLSDLEEKIDILQDYLDDAHWWKNNDGFDILLPPWEERY